MAEYSNPLRTRVLHVDDVLKEMVNAILEDEKEKMEEGKGKLKLQVEEVDTGIFFSPVTATELIKSPAHMEDLKENTGMLIDMKVREVVRGLLTRVVMISHINERKEVLIKNHGVHEAEILKTDLEDAKLKEEREKILEEKSNMMSKAVKAALERIMRG